MILLLILDHNNHYNKATNFFTNSENGHTYLMVQPSKLLKIILY